MNQPITNSKVNIFDDPKKTMSPQKQDTALPYIPTGPQRQAAISVFGKKAGKDPEVQRAVKFASMGKLDQRIY